MTNIFKPLDQLFPCGEERRSGEVVSVQVIVTLNNAIKGEMQWKRKAWHVNASVNAWHLHRGLCRELREDYSQYFTDSEQVRTAKNLLAIATMFSYENNWKCGEQYHRFVLCTSDDGSLPSLWFDTCEGDPLNDYRELCLPSKQLKDRLWTWGFGNGDLKRSSGPLTMLFRSWVANRPRQTEEGVLELLR